MDKESQQSLKSQLEIEKLKEEIDTLKKLIYKDNYSDLQIFTKKVQFKSNVNIDGKLTQTGITPIADGSYTFIKATHSTLEITTKNGIVTNIAIS